jgi:hypothetical protein
MIARTSARLWHTGMARLLASNDMLRLIVAVSLGLAHSLLPPIAAIAILTHAPGIDDRPGLFLMGWIGIGLFAILAVATLLLSIVLGAALRLLARSLDTVSVIGIYLVPALGFILGGSLLRTVANLVPDLQQGQGIYILLNTALWIMTIGYLAKIPWDDLRDRLVRQLDTQPAQPSAPSE